MSHVQYHSLGDSHPSVGVFFWVGKGIVLSAELDERTFGMLDRYNGGHSAPISAVHVALDSGFARGNLLAKASQNVGASFAKAMPHLDSSID